MSSVFSQQGCVLQPIPKPRSTLLACTSRSLYVVWTARYVLPIEQGSPFLYEYPALHPLMGFTLRCWTFLDKSRSAWTSCFPDYVLTPRFFLCRFCLCCRQARRETSQVLKMHERPEEQLLPTTGVAFICWSICSHRRVVMCLSACTDSSVRMAPPAGVATHSNRPCTCRGKCPTAK